MSINMYIKQISRLILSFSVVLSFSAIGWAQDQLILINGKKIKGSAITINKDQVKFEDAYTGKRQWYKGKQIKKLLDKQDSGTLIEYERYQDYWAIYRALQ